MTGKDGFHTPRRSRLASPKHLFGGLRRWWRDASGAAAVEFAMCAPIMITLSLGTLEIGRAMLAYHSLSLAAFEAGRYAMVHGTGSGDPATVDELRTLVTAQLHGVDPDELELTADWDPNKQPGSFVTITLEYPFEFLVHGLPAVTLRSDITTIIAN
jgi:Flp pilus assembly protein TadG